MGRIASQPSTASTSSNAVEPPPVDADAMDDDAIRQYPWLADRDERFTLALVLDVGEVLVRHGYPAPVGRVLVDLTASLHRSLHPCGDGYQYLPPDA